MRRSRIIIISLLVMGISILIILESHRPVPPEVKEVQVQDASLRGAGSTLYIPDAYQEYQNDYQEAKLKFNKERKKLVWFRQYRSVAADFAKLLQKGEQLRLKVEKKRE